MELWGSTLFRAGPGRFDRGGERYEHVLDGDGYILKVECGWNSVLKWLLMYSSCWDFRPVRLWRQPRQQPNPSDGAIRKNSMVQSKIGRKVLFDPPLPPPLRPHARDDLSLSQTLWQEEEAAEKVLYRNTFGSQPRGGALGGNLLNLELKKRGQHQCSVVSSLG